MNFNSYIDVIAVEFDTYSEAKAFIYENNLAHVEQKYGE